MNRVSVIKKEAADRTFLHGTLLTADVKIKKDATGCEACWLAFDKGYLRPIFSTTEKRKKEEKGAFESVKITLLKSEASD